MSRRRERHWLARRGPWWAGKRDTRRESTRGDLSRGLIAHFECSDLRPGFLARRHEDQRFGGSRQRDDARERAGRGARLQTSGLRLWQQGLAGSSAIHAGILWDLGARRVAVQSGEPRARAETLPGGAARLPELLAARAEGKFRSDAQRATQELQLECPVEPVSNAELLSSAPQLVATAELAAPPQRAAPLMPTPSEPPSDRASLPPVTPLVEQANQAPYWNAHRVVGWSAIASGVITGGVALYFMNAALRDHNEAAQIAASYQYAPKAPPWLDEQEAQHRDLRAARILGVTAGALVAGGAIVLSLSPKPHSSSRVSATLAVYPGHLGAACSGSF